MRVYAGLGLKRRGDLDVATRAFCSRASRPMLAVFRGAVLVASLAITGCLLLRRRKNGLNIDRQQVEISSSKAGKARLSPDPPEGAQTHLDLGGGHRVLHDTSARLSTCP